MNQIKDLGLLSQIQAGDGQAKEELVRKYQPMIRYILKNQNVPSDEYDDYFQEGSIGLLKAIEEYKPEQYQIKFSTFAYICILRRVYNAIKTTMKKRRFSFPVISLNASLGEEDPRSLLDAIADWRGEPFAEVEDALVGKRLDTVLKTYLSPVEYRVIKLVLHGYNYTEMQNQLSLPLKVIDNARTRAKLKLKKILYRYGSLLNPQLPLKARKRKDLTIQLDVG